MNGNGSTEAFDVDAFLDGYKPRTATVRICQRADLLDEHAQTEAELAKHAQAGDADAAKEATDRLLALEQQIEDAEVEFHFAAVTYQRWYELMAEYPATDADREAQPNAAVGEAFQVHAVAECAVDPQLSADQVRAMRAKLRPDDFDRLWLEGVITCCEGAVVVPKSPLATGARNLFDEFSTNRKARRSRGRSSSGAAAKKSRSTTTTKKVS